MSERKELGRISKAIFGYGGYQDAMIGLTLVFSGKNWGTSTFIGEWSLERSEYTKWTEEERRAGLAAAVWKLHETLKAAKKNHVAELAGTPVECTFDANMLRSWRILTEVL